MIFFRRGASFTSLKGVIVYKNNADKEKIRVLERMLIGRVSSIKFNGRRNYSTYNFYSKVFIRR